MAIRIPPKTDQDAKDSTAALLAAGGPTTVAWDDVQDKPTTFPPTQGVAVADATDEASAVTQLNALLASLRASGAIAT